MSSTLISSTLVPHFSGHNQRYSVCFVVTEAHCGFQCLSKGRTIPTDPYPDTSETPLPLARCRAQRRDALQHQRHCPFMADIAYPTRRLAPSISYAKTASPPIRSTTPRASRREGWSGLPAGRAGLAPASSEMAWNFTEELPQLRTNTFTWRSLTTKGFQEHHTNFSLTRAGRCSCEPLFSGQWVP